MLALSDALPTGHRAMANPTLQLHFGCGRATPPISHSHNWPFGRMQHFFVQNWTKKLFFAHKDPKTNFDAWMILQKPVLSFTGNDFLKMANLKVISSSATLNALIDGLWTTCSGSAFQGLITLCAKLLRRILVVARGLSSFHLCPRVGAVLYSKNKLKSILSILWMILYTCSMSVLCLLYDNVVRFSSLSLSGYGRCFMDGTLLVALCWTFSISFMSVL